jgi:NADPH:quinone reductase-like Zn-dependent oxidoreductase
VKAITQDRYGSAAVLESGDLEMPEIGDDQVLLRVHAAGVNPADWAIMSGLPYIARPVYGLRRPKTGVRGTDVAGTVEAVGSSVTRFKPGDEVFGSADGSYAEFAAASEDHLVPKPTNLTFEQAAAAPMAGQVAILALRGVEPGQKVLINGASGGIGSFAVQIAKSQGAEVTAVVSTRNVDMARSIGADHVIDYTKENFTRGAERYDLILDNVSNHSLSDLRRALAPTGILIPNGGRFDKRWMASGGRVIAGMVTFRFVSQTLRTFVMSTKLETLVELKQLIEAGKVTPVMDRTYPLSETAQALAYVGEGHARGKTVISMSAAPTASKLDPAAAVVPAASSIAVAS